MSGFPRHQPELNIIIAVVVIAALVLIPKFCQKYDQDVFNAIKTNDEVSIKHLLDKGLDPAIKDADGYTPLHRASSAGSIYLMPLFLDKGVDVNIKGGGGMTPLHVATYGKQDRAMELLISRGANVNAQDDFGYTALHYAAEYGRMDLVRLLLNKGADKKLRTRAFNQTAAELAAANGFKGIVEILK
ncbi:MAG: ankyrin repeat domain-containing protein [Deltaproteobacteria bacterium]|nr:ankyrin repeat domain-containing protein [Deltaproteobacteria bacterium]